MVTRSEAVGDLQLGEVPVEVQQVEILAAHTGGQELALGPAGELVVVGAGDRELVGRLPVKGRAGEPGAAEVAVGEGAEIGALCEPSTPR